MFPLGVVYSLKKPCVMAFWDPCMITAGQMLPVRSVSHAMTVPAAMRVMENTGRVNQVGVLSKSVTSAAKRMSGQCGEAWEHSSVSVLSAVVPGGSAVARRSLESCVGRCIG